MAADLTGRKIANVLTVLRIDDSERMCNKIRWICLCDICGKESIHNHVKLTKNASRIKSCGCLYEATKKRVPGSTRDRREKSRTEKRSKDLLIKLFKAAQKKKQQELQIEKRPGYVIITANTDRFGHIKKKPTGREKGAFEAKAYAFGLLRMGAIL